MMTEGAGRLISFALTTQQVIDMLKDVTRRNGWKFLKAGDRLQPVNKVMGFQIVNGVREKPVRLLPPGWFIRVVSTRWERLDAISAEDVVREGFAGKTPEWFVNFYCEHNGGDGSQLVNRIEFRYEQEGTVSEIKVWGDLTRAQQRLIERAYKANKHVLKLSDKNKTIDALLEFFNLGYGTSRGVWWTLNATGCDLYERAHQQSLPELPTEKDAANLFKVLALLDESMGICVPDGVKEAIQVLERPNSIRADQWPTIEQDVREGRCVVLYDYPVQSITQGFDERDLYEVNFSDRGETPIVSGDCLLTVIWLDQPAKLESVSGHVIGANYPNKPFGIDTDKPFQIVRTDDYVAFHEAGVKMREEIAQLRQQLAAKPTPDYRRANGVTPGVFLDIDTDIWHIAAVGYEGSLCGGIDLYGGSTPFDAVGTVPLCPRCVALLMSKQAEQLADQAHELQARRDILDNAVRLKAELLPDHAGNGWIDSIEQLAQAVRDERKRANQAEAALDDLQHDIGVFAFCGSYMDKDDKESLRSDDTIALLETWEFMKDEQIMLKHLLNEIAQHIVHDHTNVNGRWAYVHVADSDIVFNLDDKGIVWPKSPVMEALRQVWHWKHPKEEGQS